MTLSQKALVFATAAHAACGQVRKYSGQPYIVHPIEVADIVRTVDHDDAMIAAAYLHDTVEDTAVTLDLILQEFGADVAELVGWLTDVSKPEDGNRKTRKAIDREHSAMAPRRAQTIKLADMISNTRDIAVNDPNFWIVYRREKIALLKVMLHGDSTLWKQAWDQVS